MTKIERRIAECMAAWHHRAWVDLDVIVAGIRDVRRSTVVDLLELMEAAGYVERKSDHWLFRLTSRARQDLKA